MSSGSEDEMNDTKHVMITTVTKHVTVICRMEATGDVMHMRDMRNQEFEKELNKTIGKDVKVSAVEWMKSDDGDVWRWAMRVRFDQLKMVCACKMMYVEIPAWQRAQLGSGMEDLVILRYPSKESMVEAYNSDQVYRKNYWGMLKLREGYALRYTRAHAKTIAIKEKRESVVWPVYVLTEVNRNYSVREGQEAVDESGWKGQVDAEDRKGPRGTRTWHVAAPNPPSFKIIRVDGEDWTVITIEEDRRARREWWDAINHKEGTTAQTAQKGMGKGKGNTEEAERKTHAMIGVNEVQQMIQQAIEPKMAAFTTRVMKVVDQAVEKKASEIINKRIESMCAQQAKVTGQMETTMSELKGMMEKLMAKVGKSDAELSTQPRQTAGEFMIGTPDAKKRREGDDEDEEVDEDSDEEETAKRKRGVSRTPRMRRISKRPKAGEWVAATTDFETTSARGKKNITVEENMKGEVRTEDGDGLVVKFKDIKGLVKIEAENVKYIEVTERDEER